MPSVELAPRATLKACALRLMACKLHALPCNQRPCLLAVFVRCGVRLLYRLALSPASTHILGLYTLSVSVSGKHCHRLPLSSVCQRAVNSFALFTSKAFGGCLCRCKARTSALCLHVVFIAFGLQAVCPFHCLFLGILHLIRFFFVQLELNRYLCARSLKNCERFAFAPPLMVAAIRGFLLPTSKRTP